MIMLLEGFKCASFWMCCIIPVLKALDNDDDDIGNIATP